ncbi:MAG TPA: ribonuclease H-like domain-containing protein [Saprospiraceae bacterium]|nr:ribonuclease H-like domain-containing protein [Saprospiraceae bacterium]
MAYSSKNLTSTLFLDIETVSEFPDYESLPAVFKELWDKKAVRINPESATDLLLRDKIYKNNAAIYAEFGKIVCISVGYINSDKQIRAKSFAGHDEKQILEEFTALISQHFDDPKSYFFCGHNIKEFDIPYICRRMVKHGVTMPHMLDIAGKKPWQTEQLMDTLDLWRFGDIKGYTSLALICAVLGIESPKSDLDGSKVGPVYYEDQDLERIVSYCVEDVIATMKVMFKFLNVPMITDEDIQIIPWKEPEID